MGSEHFSAGVFPQELEERKGREGGEEFRRLANGGNHCGRFLLFWDGYDHLAFWLRSRARLYSILSEHGNTQFFGGVVWC